MPVASSAWPTTTSFLPTCSTVLCAIPTNTKVYCVFACGEGIFYFLAKRCDVNENTGSSAAVAIDYTKLTTGLVCSYVAHNNVPASELVTLIASTHAALASLAAPDAPATPVVEKLTPARIGKSITHEALISFEDGKPYKTLKRHLRVLGLTPKAYREKWGLPPDYPTTAASYSERRSALARSLGLGQQRRNAVPKAANVAATAETVAEKPKRAARPRKAKALAGSDLG